MFLSSRSDKLIRHHKKTFIIAGLMFCSNSFAAQYNFVVQPIHSPAKMKEIYQPMADYLNKRTGHTFNIVTVKSFVSYWAKMNKGQYDLVLDAAHFADYRVKNHDYTVLAKINDTVSYSLVTNEDINYFDADELIGQRIATLASPSIGGVRLLNMYPNISRQPVVIGTNNFQETLKKLKSNKVSAALVPTSLISGDSSVNTIMVTDPIPHMAISASNRVDKITKDKIRSALLSVNNSADGKKLLARLKIAGFEKASNKTYAGYGLLLKDVWGY